MKKQIFISTGEISGDLYGAELAKEILQINPEINLIGLGSNKMKAAGVEIIEDLSFYSGVGIIENIRAITPSIKIYNKIKKLFSVKKPELIVLIDNQGLNIKICKLARKLNIKIVYFIGPQEWLWGIGNNWKKIINNIDILFTIFKQEYDFYKNKNDESINNKIKYLGHPLKELIEKKNKNEIKKELDFKEEIVIGLMPGSRLNEIKSLLPIFIDFSNKIKNKNTRIILIINDIWINFTKDNYKLDNIDVFTENSSIYMQSCDLILAASGTVTLEAVLLKIPIISCYKISKLSYNIAKIILKTKYTTLPNIILNKKVIPELLQNDVNVNTIIIEYENILKNENYIKEFEINCNEIKKELEPDNTIKNIAYEINEIIKNL